MRQYAIIRGFYYKILLIACLSTNSFGQTILQGEILNYDGKALVGYYPTTEGVHATYWKTIKPDAKGRFKIKLENENLATVRVYFQHTMYRFLHGNDSKLFLSIDQSKLNRPAHKYSYGKKEQFVRDSVRKAGIVEISGDYKEINQYYNSVMRTAFGGFPVDGTTHSHLIRNAQTPSDVNRILDSLSVKEVNIINGFEHLTSEIQESGGELSFDQVKAFLKNEVKAYYTGVFLGGMLLKRRDQLKVLDKDSTASLDIYNSRWVDMSEEFLSSISNSVKANTASIEFNRLLTILPYFQLEYQTLERFENKMTLDEIVTQALIYPDTLFYNSEDTKLASRLRDLKLFMDSQTFYSPALLNSYYELKNIYPNSKNLAHFEPQVEKIKTYINKSTEGFSEGKIISKNYLDFLDLIHEFEGSQILIDVWATWCHPCIEQFQYKKPIEEYCAQNNITILYVSIDKPSFKERWKENIKYNELKGYHVRANNQLINSMWEYLGGFKGAIPRYAIVNSEGNLIVPEASMPRELTKLKKELKSVSN